MNVNGFILNSINIEHREIIRYREYEYPIRLVFSGNPSEKNKLLGEFSKHVSETRIINSRYGNPYKCDFGIPKIYGTSESHVIIDSIGHSYRI